MLKALIRLILIILIPLFLLTYMQSYNPIKIIQTELTKQYNVDCYRGTFYLLIEALKQDSHEKWPEKFKKLTADFDYQIQLLNINSPTFSKQQIEELYDQEFNYSDPDYLDGKPAMLRQKIPNSNWVIEMALEDSREAIAIRNSRGTFYLLEEHLNLFPQQEWPAELNRLEDEFGVILLLTNLNDLNLPVTEIKKVTPEGSFISQVIDGNETIHYHLKNSHWVLSAGPISSNQVRIGIIMSVMLVFLLVITLGLLSWLVPLWRDLKALSLQAFLFGEGHLDRRVILKKRSIIANLGKSFNVMANSIQKLIHSNRQLTNAVAHDLRTPLARLKFAFEIMESEECNEEEKRHYKKIIDSSIDSLDYLINQTLIHARYSRVADAKSFSNSNLSSVITDEFEQYSREHKDIQFSLTIDEQLADSEQLADPRAIVRALSNLLSNAVRFSNCKVNVAFCCSKKDYLIVVEDDGPGIDELHNESIFQSFSQVNNEERGAGQGHGLGLAIVHQIAVWHKGSVSVKRSYLTGARFEFSWPRDKQLF